MNTLLILSQSATASADKSLASLASFLGCTVQVLDTVNGIGHLAVHGTPKASVNGIAIHADTFASLFESGSQLPVDRDGNFGGNILVYGFSTKTPRNTLTFLSRGRISGVQAVKSSSVGMLPERGRAFTNQLAGAEFPRLENGNEAAFSIAESEPDVIPLVTLSGKPTFVCLNNSTGHVFLSTVHDFPHTHEPVTEEGAIERSYNSLLPVLLFVRHFAGEASWHGGSQSARLIIDDPVLRSRYGYLDFRTLFDSLDRCKYAATVAYIPWNYSRTSAKQASFFLAHKQNFDICVHGCDHTNNEYGTSNSSVLLHKSSLAMKRMEQHETRTGLGFQPVMVFPQGHFSCASLNALRSTNYIGAINSTRFPLDFEARHNTFGDLLLPAICGPEGFPVFLRHYPKNIFPTLFNLFLGRAAFIVEHHDYFKTGLPQMEGLVERMNRCEPKLRWASLSETLIKACWKRKLSAKKWEMRFFTDTFEVTNEASDIRSYVLWKVDSAGQSSGSIAIGRNHQPMEYIGDRLQTEVTLAPGQKARVQICRPPELAQTVPNAGIAYSGKVFIRRALSEFRDEVLAKNPVLLAPAKAVVRLMKAGGDARSQIAPTEVLSVRTRPNSGRSGKEK